MSSISIFICQGTNRLFLLLYFVTFIIVLGVTLASHRRYVCR